jgi:SAM-dependent methyltransferase
MSLPSPAVPSTAAPPDVESSTDHYALRFRGSTGRWFLERQEATVLEILSGLGPSLRILEVGGGHAQLTPALVRAGHRVTVQGSSPGCAARLRRVLEASLAPFVASSLVHLPFEDRAFDAVISIRTLAHVDDPEVFLASCARVSTRAIVLDFPSIRSANALSNALWRVKRGIEKDTRPFRCFTPHEIEGLLRARGFRQARAIPQFFLPMAFHRLHGRRLLARFLEGAPRRVGLTSLLGSPVLGLYLRTGGGAA